MAARTAVIAGTAGAVSHRQQERYAAKDQAAYEQQQAAQQQAYEQQQAAAPPPPAPAPAAGGDDMISKLKELAGLRDAGVLTEAEFDAAKAKVLAS